LSTVPGAELSRRTWRELGDDHAIDLAAAIAYYAVLSLFPLAIGLVSLFSLVLESHSVEEEVHSFFHTYLPGSQGILTANVEAVNNIRGVLGIVSIVGLLWSSTLLFGAISRAVNRAWDIEQDRPFFIEKPRHILMALSVAPVFLISVALTTGLQVLGSEGIPVLGRFSFLEHNGINALFRPVPFVFSVVIFFFIYKFTPLTRTYWRYVWPGALLAALLFEASKSIFVFYLENYAAYERIYGTLASMIVLLAWAYLSGFIVVIGAEVSSEYYRIRMGGVRGRPIATNRRRRERRQPRGEQSRLPLD
jgi:membrane protein